MAEIDEISSTLPPLEKLTGLEREEIKETFDSVTTKTWNLLKTEQREISREWPRVILGWTLLFKTEPMRTPGQTRYNNADDISRGAESVGDKWTELALKTAPRQGETRMVCLRNAEKAYRLAIEARRHADYEENPDVWTDSPTVDRLKTAVHTVQELLREA